MNKRTVMLFKALGCSWRLKILEHLSKGTMCICELDDLYSIDKTTLSRHVKALVDTGLVKENRNGTRKELSIADRRVLEILELAKSITDVSSQQLE
ncbi:MAG TPA: transcriptional regulator [Mesotoga infera]|jgi:ArsR family transcriptional regulator|uniref:Transcriptional regulator n=1 Tax=Mesotoga infera TaxID=1236046 RepID=A0A3D3TLI9_9BACT|nr:transcriptional regulator [Mesotoga infera]